MHWIQIGPLILFFGGLSWASGEGLLPRSMWGLFSMLSLISFLAYYADKRAAQHGRSRVPEQTLHLLALAGGWPGALLAQQILHHKTKKQPFRFIFWMTVALNSAALGFYLFGFAAP